MPVSNKLFFDGTMIGLEGLKIWSNLVDVIIGINHLLIETSRNIC